MISDILPIGILQAIIERGLIYALVIIGVYLTSRIIAFDDLTVEGSFGLGGALTAASLIYGLNIWATMPLVFIAGALAGCITGFLHTKLGFNNLISGIVVTTGLFSITLALASANVSIVNAATLFGAIPTIAAPLKYILILLPINLAIIWTLRRFLASEIGFLIQAVGDNPQMLTNLGKSIATYKITALMISNALTALAGSLFVQYVGYFSIWSNVGLLITALAGLILAQIFSSGLGIGIILGSIAYQMIIALSFELNIGQEWNKLITAILIILLLSLNSSKFLTRARK